MKSYYQIIQLLIAIFLSGNSIAKDFDFVTGKLHFDQSRNYYIETLEGEIEVSIPERYKDELTSLTDGYLDSQHFLMFKGKESDGVFNAFVSPQIRSGSHTLSGVLNFSNGNYYIGNKIVFFDLADVVNDSSFNNRSIDYFMNKRVNALVKIEEGMAIITGIIPADIYSALTIPSVRAKEVQDTISTEISKVITTEEDLYDEFKTIVFEEMSDSLFKTKINDYALDLLYDDQVSKNYISIREVIFQKQGKSVVPGDQGLIITLSGRQGDDTGALGGHFAVGSVRVRDDFGLDGEIWNFYSVPNEKRIIAGHNNMIDYFGNLTAGQNNYRPTYSLIFYGVSEKIRRAIRDELGREYFKLRESSEEFGVHYNCTTTAVEALSNVGIVGEKSRDIVKKTFAAAGSKAISFFGSIFSGVSEMLGVAEKKKAFQYILSEDPNKYVPRLAFNSFLKRVKRISRKFNVKRVDYILHAQTPSDRLNGGAPSKMLTPIKKGKDMNDKIMEEGSSLSKREIHQRVQKLMATQ